MRFKVISILFLITSFSFALTTIPISDNNWANFNWNSSNWVGNNGQNFTINISNDGLSQLNILNFEIKTDYYTNTNIIEILEWDPNYENMNCYTILNHVGCNVTTFENYTYGVKPGNNTWVKFFVETQEPEGNNYPLRTEISWGKSINGTSGFFFKNYTMNYNVDLTPPQISFTNPSIPGQNITNNEKLTGTYSDNTSGINEIKINYNGVKSLNPTNMNEGMWDHIGNFLLNGKTIITAIAYDNANNIGTTTITANAPIIIVELPSICVMDCGRFPIQPPEILTKKQLTKKQINKVNKFKQFLREYIKTKDIKIKY